MPIKICEICQTSEVKRSSICNICYRKQYYRINKTRINEKNRQWRLNNPERKEELRRNWRKENRERQRDYNKKWRLNNLDQIRTINKKWQLNNKIHHRNICKRWKAANSEHVKIIARSYMKSRYATDRQYKLSRLLRNRLYSALKNDQKVGSAVKDLGCSIPELIRHLESQFQPGMTWENWSRKGWHIDHIIPLASFNLSDQNELKKACHYSNLQPLWAEDNLRKSNSE